MKTWIYSWLIYPLGYSLAALVGVFNTKIRDTLRLRAWKDFLSLRFNVGQPIEYWVHVASHGELEYAIPILQELSARKKRVLVTYYSISAKGPVEQLPKSFPNVSLVVPLPHDGLGLMREFVSLVRKQGVHHLLLMKYELWPGLLWECNAQGIKVLLVDALKPSWFHRRLLHKLDGILSGYSFEVDSIVHPCVKVVGDTRVERVLQRVEQSHQRLSSAVSPALRARLSEKPVLVCGSMWGPDNKLLLKGLADYLSAGGDCHLIWVPHELDPEEGRNVARQLSELGFQGYNIDESREVPKGRLAVIVMKKGILAELYRLGQAAYVGGGFGSGVHSVWEPAICGATVACGPRTERSPESTELAECGLLDRLTTEAEMADWLKKKLGATVAKAEENLPRIKGLLSRHVGAAQRIVQVCEGMV